MNGLYGLAALIVWCIFIIGLMIYSDITQALKCESKGGVYVYKINKCMKKEYFITAE